MNGPKAKICRLGVINKMSTSAKIYFWKQKSEIDYIPLFMSLWLSLNVWIKFRFVGVNTDRELIEALKNIDDSLYSDFSKFINDSGQYENTSSIIFKGYFSELYHALESTKINIYKKNKGKKNKDEKNKGEKNKGEKDKGEKDKGEKIISFHNAVLEWNKGRPKFHSVIKKEEDEDKIKISPNLYIDSNDKDVFKAYIDVLYRVRCALFHGDIIIDPENEKVIRFSYLTLQMLMKDV